jgi:hypothetical protein
MTERSGGEGASGRRDERKRGTGMTEMTRGPGDWGTKGLREGGSGL